ncbi:MAG: hypothetical protein WDZ35_13880 [Crocinitomicaceae bacterium]
MKENIIEFLKDVDFSKKYAFICNQYSNFNEGGHFNKKDLSEIFNVLNFDLKYASHDKSFFKDYEFDSFRFRFVLTYKYGFIECFYTFFNGSDLPFGGRLNDISEWENKNFRSEAEHNFPIATSKEDLYGILSSLFELHSALLDKIEKHFSKKNI